MIDALARLRETLEKQQGRIRHHESNLRALALSLHDLAALIWRNRWVLTPDDVARLRDDVIRTAGQRRHERAASRSSPS